MNIFSLFVNIIYYNHLNETSRELYEVAAIYAIINKFVSRRLV